MVLSAKKKGTRQTPDKVAALKEVTKEPTARLNANIPESLYRQLKIKAAEDDIKINDLVIEWVNEYLSK